MEPVVSQATPIALRGRAMGVACETMEPAAKRLCTSAASASLGVAVEGNLSERFVFFASFLGELSQRTNNHAVPVVVSQVVPEHSRHCI